MSAFVDEHRARFGVEPICRALGVSASAYYHRASGERSERAVSDERLLAVIREVHLANYEAYGYRRTWKALLRAGEPAGLLVAGRRGPGNFPAPYSHTKHRNRLWRWADVLDWASTDEATRRDAQIVAYANASLEMRNREAHLQNYKSDTKLLIEATRSFEIDPSQDDSIVTHGITRKSRRANKV